MPNWIGSRSSVVQILVVKDIFIKVRGVSRDTASHQKHCRYIFEQVTLRDTKVCAT